MIPLLLAVGLVLADGRRVEGTDLRRRDATYELTLASGEVLSLPEALVREIRLTDDPPAPAAPTAIRPAEPETLAGDPASRRPPPTDAQRRAIGPGSTFVEPRVDPFWKPTPAVDPSVDVFSEARSSFVPSRVDPNWSPSSDFDAGRDVLAGSRSAFAPRAIEPFWRPSDGFEPAPSSPVAKERFFAGAIPPAAPASPAAEVDPVERCAERLLPAAVEAPGPRAAREDEPALEPLRLSLWRVERDWEGRRSRVVFAVDGASCHALGGDLPKDRAGDAALAAWVDAVGARRPLPATRDAKLALALAFVTMTEPDASGARDATLRVLSDREALLAESRKPPARCSISPADRNRRTRAALDAVRAPRLAGDLATFFTWSPARGVVRRHTVSIPATGVPKVVTEIVAEHVGPHEDDRLLPAPTLVAPQPEQLAPKPAGKGQGIPR